MHERGLKMPLSPGDAPQSHIDKKSASISRRDTGFAYDGHRAENGKPLTGAIKRRVDLTHAEGYLNFAADIIDAACAANASFKKI